MIYDKELVHYKTTKFPHPKGLQCFRAATQNYKPPNEVSSFEALLYQSKFGSNSIHLVNYLWEPQLRYQVRLFWFGIVLLAICGCIVMYSIIYSQHDAQTLRTVVDTSQLPLYNVEFPATAICPMNNVNWLRFKAAEERFLPASASSFVRQVFTDLVEVIDTMSFTHLRPISLLLHRSYIPRQIENINLADLIGFLAIRCDEIFFTCRYDETVYDCCKIFIPERTERGLCFVFNSLVSEESQKKKVGGT